MLTLKTIAHMVLGTAYTMECVHVDANAETWLIAGAYVAMAIHMAIDDFRS